MGICGLSSQSSGKRRNQEKQESKISGQNDGGSHGRPKEAAQNDSGNNAGYAIEIKDRKIYPMRSADNEEHSKSKAEAKLAKPEEAEGGEAKNQLVGNGEIQGASKAGFSEGQRQPEEGRSFITEDEKTEIQKEYSFEALIHADDDFRSKSDNLDKCLSSPDADLNEKLRETIFLMKQMTEPDDGAYEDDKSINLFQEKFMVLAQKHCKRLYDAFSNVRMGYKPLIKLLQVFDLMLQNFEEENLIKHKSILVRRMFAFLQEVACDELDWRSLRKLYDENSEKELVKFDKRLEAHLFTGFLDRMDRARNALVWRPEKKAIKCAEAIIDSLRTLSKDDPSKFLACLMKGRFDKEELKFVGLNFEGSLITGDEGGLYLLINKVPANSFEESIIFESGVSEEFLNDKRGTNSKVLLGKGAFGMVGLALAVFGNMSVDAGQLVCVKKSLRIGDDKTKTQNTLKNITDQAFDDFFSKKLNSAVYTPRPLDIAILTNKLNPEKHRKGYTFMEIVPENTAAKVFRSPKYQKWEFQKPYMIQIMKTMRHLLLNDRVLNSDLKPQNTLFDPLSRKMAIIDLGSSIFIQKNEDMRKFDCSVGGFGLTLQYCPPEILDEKCNQEVDLFKAVSYLCGATIAEITSGAANWKKEASNSLLGNASDLDESSKESFKNILKALIDKDPGKRTEIEQAIAEIQNIGSDEYIERAMYEQYIFKARELILKDPSALNLNADIIETRLQGIIPQSVVERNPKKATNQKTKFLNADIDAFFGENVGVYLLLGEAGSGKSLALQLRFLQEIEDWSYGKAIPIFFNMADDFRLERVIARINSNVGCNLSLDARNEEIHLFIDSYDEGAGERATRQCPNPQGGRTLIDEYMDNLQTWKAKKILISCRTDFVVQGDGDDDFSDFLIFNGQGALNPRVRYIAPIGYETDKSDSKKEVYLLAEQWLTKEKISDSKQILLKIRRFGLEERMRTGLMFKMIMSMFTKNDDNFQITSRLRGFSIYKRTIVEEFKQNWLKMGTFVDNSRPARQRELIIKQIKRFYREEEFNAELQKDREEKAQMEMIWEGLERMGEIIAAEMTTSNRNRIKFSELESLAGTEDGEGDCGDTRIEWRTLFQMCKIMGLKLERKKQADSENSSQKGEEFDLGFRHETYKNYFLLKGLKRILSERAAKQSKFEQALKKDEFILDSVLGNVRTIRNFELLKLFGEEIRWRDKELRENLRLVLTQEQKRTREGRASGKAKEAGNASGNVNEGRKAAATISLLVAGDYDFSGQDLGDLNLSNANLRGGMFTGAKFERTNLAQANLRHSNISNAKFLQANLSDVDLGIWPDLIGHENEVLSLSFNHNGSKIASSSNDKTIKVWDSENGICLMTLKGHGSVVKSVKFSPDGGNLLSGSDDKSLKIWEAENGKCLKTLKGHDNFVTSVCYHPEGGRLISGSCDKTIKVWDSLSGQCLKTLEGHGNYVISVCFSPNGKNIASGSSDRTVKIWDFLIGACLRTLEGHGEWVNSVCFSPDGATIASGSGDRTVRIWEASSGECIKTLEGHGDWVRTLSFSPDGLKLVSGSSDRAVKVWDSSSGKCVHVLEGHGNVVLSVCFSPDGKRIASGSRDKTVKLWDNSSVGECVQTLEGHRNYVTSVCFRSDCKRIATGSYDKSVKIWDVVSGECLQTLQGHQNWVTSVGFSSDGKKIASGSRDKTVKIWDIAEGDCVQTLIGHGSSVFSVGFSHDGKELTSESDDKSIKTWEVASGKCIRTQEGHGRVANHSGLSWLSADGKWRANSVGNSVKLFQAEGKDSWLLRMSFKSVVEETFTCWKSVFEKCIINEKNKRDLLLKKIVTQRGASYSK